MNWEPISTAPKDGTVVDLWHTEYGRMTDTWWDDDSWVVSGRAEGFSHWMLVSPPTEEPKP